MPIIGGNPGLAFLGCMNLSRISVTRAFARVMLKSVDESLVSGSPSKE